MHLRNVRVKTGMGGSLEGTLWEERDERYRERRDVTVVDLRRRDHEERFGERARDVQRCARLSLALICACTSTCARADSRFGLMSRRRHREYWAARSKE